MHRRKFLKISSLTFAGLYSLPFNGIAGLLFKDTVSLSSGNILYRKDAMSKRVARDSKGKIYLLTIDSLCDDKSTVLLRVGQPSSRTLSDFSEPFQPIQTLDLEGSLISAGMVIDADDQLHLVWSTDTSTSYYAIFDLKKGSINQNKYWQNPETKKTGALVLAPDSSYIGDITLDPHGNVWSTWIVAYSKENTHIFIGAYVNNQWQMNKVHEGDGIAPPSLMVDSQSIFHLGWNNINGELWILTSNSTYLGSSLLPKPVLISDKAYGYRPVIAESFGPNVCVYESYLNQLHHFTLSEGNFRISHINQQDKRFNWDTIHSPQFCIDHFGIPWMFFIDSARQNVFYSRWLQTKWSNFGSAGRLVWNSPRMADNHLRIDRIAVEERMFEAGDDLGLLIENTSTKPTIKFSRIAVPKLVANSETKVLFFDLKEIASLDGIALNFNQPLKFGRIIGQGDPGGIDCDGVGPFSRVLKENGKYRMWYSGWKAKTLNVERWWEGYRIGYAESNDGQYFHRKNLGLASFNGKADTNFIPGLPYVPQGLYYDVFDPNPKKRYKILKFLNAGSNFDEVRAGRLNPWTGRTVGQLLVSADGINWEQIPATMDFPGGRPLELIPQSLFFDPLERNPEKRYKAYGYSSLNSTRRAGSYAYSADAIHWTAWADNPVLDAFAEATPPVRGGMVNQVHDMVVWQYGDYYLAFYQKQNDGVNLDVHLAVSRDGEQFMFLNPNEPFIPAGVPGEWDMSQINPSVPLIDEHEIKIYYGSVNKHGNESLTAKNFGGLGMATLRLDGFTNLQPELGHISANFTTIPIRPGNATRIYSNADCGQGEIVAEILDFSSGDVLPGYSRDNCIPIKEDSLVHHLMWNQHDNLNSVQKDFQIRFYLIGTNSRPKLFSIQFK